MQDNVNSSYTLCTKKLLILYFLVIYHVPNSYISCTFWLFKELSTDFFAILIGTKIIFGINMLFSCTKMVYIGHFNP